MPFGQVWRTGANEATTFKTDKALTIGGQSLPAGTYTLWTIPEKDKWTVIFNKTSDQWGAYDYKKEDDVLRVMAKAGKAKTFVEKFMITIYKDGKVSLWWGANEVSFTVK